MTTTSKVAIYKNDGKQTYAGQLKADLSDDQARKLRDQLNALFSEHGVQMFAARQEVED